VVQNFSVELFIDGVCISSGILMSRKDRSCEMSRAVVSETEMRPFMFANIRIRETDGNWDPSILEQLATIQVVFEQAQKIKKKVKKKQKEKRHYFSNTLPAENLVDEKSKKDGTHGTRLGDAIAREPGAIYFEIHEAPGAPRDTVVFHYAPEGYLQLHDLMPHPESQYPGRTPEIVPDSPRSLGASSLQALRPLVTERVTDEFAGHEAHSEDHANQGDVKPPHTSTQSKKRAIEEVKPEVSDNGDSDVGELSPEDQLAYTRIKAQLANVRKTKMKKRIKSAHDVKPVLSGDVIVLSD